MSIVKPSKPSFVFGYWRPWKENSNLIDSYLDYVKDTSLVKYGSDTIGKYINQASKEQVLAIKSLEVNVMGGLNIVNQTLNFINRNLDIQIEQQKLANLLLQNIAELLRVPDSEKERQHSIELGVKFFINASKDSDLYTDSLEEFLKAESMMKQDYFVLHRIGCIYLYVEQYIDPEKALDYFLRAAKYASVESDRSAARLVNVLTNNINSVKSDVNNFEEQIGHLASDSYEKAAFSLYVLGRFEEAVKQQSKALKFNNNTQNRFLLAKYQIRNNQTSDALDNLNFCIEKDPVYAIAACKEIDFINEKEVLNLINNKNSQINQEINNLAEKWKNIDSIESEKIINELSELLKCAYDEKILKYNTFLLKGEAINSELDQLINSINFLLQKIQKTNFATLKEDEIKEIIIELEKAKSLPIERMQLVFKDYNNKIENDILVIGSKTSGGIVFYIDNSGKHGLVCTEIELGNTFWGGQGDIGAMGNGVADGSGMQNTQKIVEHSSWYKQGFFGTKKTPAQTAARLCLESNYNGYSDWYLPTIEELNLIYKNIGNKKFKKEYWSSTEYGATELKACPTCNPEILDNAWCFDFQNGRKKYDYKDSNWHYFLYDLKPGEPNNKSVIGVRRF
jgi:hypothetical protein